MKTKIIMDSGSEYMFEGDINQVKRLCVNINKMPMGGIVEIFKNGFIDITPNISINPSHISSLEELDS